MFFGNAPAENGVIPRLAMAGRIEEQSVARHHEKYKHYL